MMKRLFLTIGGFFFLFALTACAADKTVKTELPAWVNSPYASCSADELCAVGTASNFALAKADARNGLAKVFQARIKSSFESDTRVKNDDVSSEMRDFVSETSDVMLNATEIRETFKDNGKFYALATLDKNKAARITREEIDDLDEKMTALLQDESPAAAVRLEKLYEKRRGLNQRYITLAGESIPESVGYDQVYGNKKARVGKRHVYLSPKAGSKPSFVQTVRGVMTENGYTFATVPTEKTPVVHVSMTAERQFLKVDGFVKYDYHFVLSAPDKNGVDVERLATTFTESGLNENQAYSKAILSLKNYLKENILNLYF